MMNEEPEAPDDMTTLKTSIAKLSPLKPGEHYREMRVRESGGRLRFKLLTDVKIFYSDPLYEGDHEISFLGADGKEYVRLTPHAKIIRKGYAWNGNSPKRGFSLGPFDFWVGTPDFTATRMGSLNHDSDFQFSKTEHFPLSWFEVNQHYLQILELGGFLLANRFYQALARFSLSVWDSPKDPGLVSIPVKPPTV